MQFPQQNKMQFDNSQQRPKDDAVPQQQQYPPQYYPGYYPPGNANSNWNLYGYEQPQQQSPNFGATPNKQVPQQQPYSNQQSFSSGMAPPDFLSNPLTDVAMQYGTRLMGTGKQMVDKEINRFITIAKLRYFFSVDTRYVVGKIKLLLFPYSNKDWSLKYNEKARLEPRHDHNAPDLYIPFMGYITYVLIAGLVLGTNDIFSPEALGIVASQALAWTVVEIVLQLVTIYFINIPTSLTTLDLLAYSGYKFVGIIICTLLGLIFTSYGYYISFLYCGASTAFFMVQTLKWRLMSEVEGTWSEPQHMEYMHVAYKRKMYFLILIGLSHIFQIWWLSLTTSLDIKKL